MNRKQQQHGKGQGNATEGAGVPPVLEEESGDGQAGSLMPTVGQDAQPPILVVIRPLASGKHVLCSQGDRRDLVCYVRVAANFVRGMLIEGAVPTPKLSERAWRYDGKLPRRRGKW